MKNKKFEKERDRLNELILKHSGISIKRFMSLDSKVYKDGEVPLKYKELTGLAASLVMRCDDCIKYHLTQCRKIGVSNGELDEIFSIALVVGGSIVIPHIRRAFDFWYDEE